MQHVTPNTIERLWELEVMQTFHESKNARKFKFQTMAAVKNQALVKLGQSYHNSDVYFISVLSIVDVSKV